MLAVGKYGRLINVQEREVSCATFFAHFQNLVCCGGVAVAVTRVQVHHGRVKTLVAFEHHMFLTSVLFI